MRVQRLHITRHELFIANAALNNLSVFVRNSVSSWHAGSTSPPEHFPCEVAFRTLSEPSFIRIKTDVITDSKFRFRSFPNPSVAVNFFQPVAILSIAIAWFYLAQIGGEVRLFGTR